MRRLHMPTSVMPKQKLSRNSILALSAATSFTCALITLIIGITRPESLSEASTIVLVAFLYFLVAILLVIGMRIIDERRLVDRLLHPPVSITMWILTLWGIPCLYSLIKGDIINPSTLLISIDTAFVAVGIVLTLVGLILMWASYLFSLRLVGTLPFLPRLGSREPYTPSVILFFAISVIAQVVQIIVAGTAYGVDASSWGAWAPFQQWIGYLQELNLLVLAVLAIDTFRRRRSPWLLIGVLGIQLTFAFSSGFMKPVLWLIVIVAMAAILEGVSLRRFLLPGIALAILGVLIVPVAEEIRIQTDSGYYSTSEIREVADVTSGAVQKAWTGGTGAAIEFFIDRTMYRQALVAYTPGIIMQRTPSIIPYQGLEQLLAVPAYIIPRALWPDKPVLARGNWFNIVYMNQPSFTTSSAAITVFGEGYMFAGWLGMVISSVILGIVLAVIYRSFVSSGLVPIYLALIPTFLDVESQFTGMFVALTQRAVVFGLVYWIMVSTSRRREARRGSLLRPATGKVAGP